ncbi:hypothetical protein PIB30_086536, partial [Stylosanthes scabra]|nr:hypothetical protein [Stylosanthes scabra]
MNTAGARFRRLLAAAAAVEPPSSAAEEEEEGRAAISWSSNSMTVGLTPMVARSFFMTWHMQQEDRVKMMTGCSVMSRWILASADSSTSMESEVDDVFVVVTVLDRSSCTTSFEHRRSPCIAVFLFLFSLFLCQRRLGIEGRERERDASCKWGAFLRTRGVGVGAEGV